LIAARNQLLPRVDAIGTYRWLGLGDDLIRSNRSGLSPLASGSDAFGVLTGGDFQEWQLGVQMTMPIGFRRELSQVRFYQLQLARERALFKEQELEVTHQLGDAIRNLVNNYNLTQTNFNRRVAAEKEVEAVLAAYQANTVTLDTLLDAQRRRADAEIAYYRSLVDYNRGIMQVHYRKGSLLEYDGVRLAEGPWPKKAYFDALRLARQRDASLYLDYGMTLPNVISRGPVNQDATPLPSDATPGELVPTVAPVEAPAEAPAEELPPPSDQPLEAPGERLQSPLLPTGEPAAPTPLRSVRMPSDTAGTQPAGPTPQAVAADPAPTAPRAGREIDISGLMPVAAETSASWEGTQRARAREGLWR
jgi:hypothetical protein